jgi:hypothetical protein
MPLRCDSSTLPIREAQASRTGINAWVRLLIGIAAVLVFIFGVGRLMALLPGAAHMAEVIEARGLRATAIYYTDFEEPAEGSEYIRHSLEYLPGRKP